MRCVYINNEAITIPDKTSLYGGSSDVYHVKKDNEELAIKIYHTDDKCEYVENWHPSEDDLNYFILCYSPGIPILLSKYKVTDEKHNFIGSATDYVIETRGNSIEQIEYLPRDTLLEYLDDILNTIPYFTGCGITLNDWNMENLFLGKTLVDENERLYLIDDTDYFVENEPFNEQAMDILIKDMLDTYLSNRDFYCKFKVLKDIKRSKNSFSYLKEITKGYCNLKECLDDYVKVYKKK